MLTFDEICDKITTRYDADQLVDLLDLTTEDILNAFEFRVAEMYDKLNEEFSDE
jgi:hypothetical protein